MSKKIQSAALELSTFVAVLKELREKCPWDKVQNMHTLRRFTVEELYELVEAIDAENMENISEELGDLMTHVVFYANIAEEQNSFTLAKVLYDTRKKLIKRHPHIYGDGSLHLRDDQEVERNWEKLKERDHRSMFGGLPKSLPSVIKAHKLQDKAARSGFDWKTVAQAAAKLKEEYQELLSATESKNQQAITEEVGDMFFALIGYARHLSVDPDYALGQANEKFKQRIEWIEATLANKDEKMSNQDLPLLQQLWNQSKKATHKK